MCLAEMTEGVMADKMLVRWLTGHVQGCSNILWGMAKQDLKAHEMYGMKGQPYPSMIEVC